MNPIKIALQLLTCVKFKIDTSTRQEKPVSSRRQGRPVASRIGRYFSDESTFEKYTGTVSHRFTPIGTVPVTVATADRDDRSRALAYFPVVGILLGSCLVYADQILDRWLPVLWGWSASSIPLRDAIMLALLFLLRLNRGLIKEENLNRSTMVQVLFWGLRGLILCVIPNPLRWISLVFMTTYSSGALAIVLKKLAPADIDSENLLWACFSLIFLSFVCGPLGFFVLGVSAGVLALLLRNRARDFYLIEGTLEVSVLWAVFFFHELWKS